LNALFIVLIINILKGNQHQLNASLCMTFRAISVYFWILPNLSLMPQGMLQAAAIVKSKV